MLLDPGAEHTIEVFASDRDSVDERLARNESSLRIALPDASFRDSLKAQIFHIRAGTVGDETRPGDPANYDVNWLRDGAYEVVALARFGEGELARRLSRRFATHDFFGGFGAEADAPGLAIWTLEEVSARLRDPEYDRSIWPHVLRKADLIEEMLDSEGKVFKPFSGPIVPRHRGQKYEELSLVAEPARNGLILGKMDNQRPIFYVNATAYLGLTRAAEVAKRVGRNDDARRFLDHARQLRMDWERALKTDPDRLNPRTRIAGLWPSGIVDQRRDTFQRLLEDSWKVRRGEDGSFEKRPAWTYFEVAEAHQWLLLGRPERAWLTLEWFWSHQTSPGLYTWWEGNGEENSFQLWPTSRGWVRPRHVTPHYWTAAEVAHLQLDMLAYETNAPGQTRVVIGTGVRPKWLDVPMSVNGLSLRSGVLDWAWDGETLTIDWRGQPGVEFAAGPAFPASTRIAVRTPVTSH